MTLADNALSATQSIAVSGTGLAAGAELTSPAPNSVLTGSHVIFGWTPVGSPEGYMLELGTTGPGSSNLYFSGVTKATAVSVVLPAYGVTVYARLYQHLGGTWQYNDYTYTEAGTPSQAAMTSPKYYSVLTGSSATFEWTAGDGPYAYMLYVGTTGAGSDDLYYSGFTTATSAAVGGIPEGGQEVYARLYSYINKVWQYTDYIYFEAGTLVKAAITSPTPGTTLTGSSVSFTWTRGVGPAKFYLCLGIQKPGLCDVYGSGDTTATSVTVNNLPTNGATVYARFYQMIDAAWQYTDYSWTAQ